MQKLRLRMFKLLFKHTVVFVLLIHILKCVIFLEQKTFVCSEKHVLLLKLVTASITELIKATWPTAGKVKGPILCYFDPYSKTQHNRVLLVWL